MENLKELVPYNEYIGDLNCTDTHLVEVIEEWKAVPGYEGFYQASTFGRIRSVFRYLYKKDGTVQPREGVLLTISYTGKGLYGRISLCKTGIHQKVLIQRIIAITWIPNPENKKEVNHKRGIKSDNRCWMIEWVTSLENNHHAHETGLTPEYSYDKNYNYAKPRLSDELVLEVRELFKTGVYTVKLLSEIYSVSSALISKIVRNKGRNHILNG